MSKNEIAWKKLFERYEILKKISENNKYIITAEQIREYREPRLMAKFDHKINLPKLFTDNSLSLLPISRGEYVISHIDTYKDIDFSNNNDIERAKLPTYLQSLNSSNIISETMAINCALASGILSDFLEEDILFSTVSGRMGSDSFGFDITNTISDRTERIQVNNAQIEIDAAYEGIGTLSLIEAKMDVSNDFHVRQLYYPYRTWSQRLSKPVRPVFLTYSNGIFSLSEYKFLNIENYNSIELINQKNYTIEDIEIELDDIIAIRNTTPIVNEPEIAFPQANSFERLINLCELLINSPMSSDQITINYAFDSRQTNYYTDAGRYLGLIEKKHYRRMPIYSLSSEGLLIMKMNYRQKQIEFCKRILSHKAFRDTFNLALELGEIPSKNQIVDIMKNSSLFNINTDGTFKRRASTIIRWMDWIFSLNNNN